MKNKTKIIIISVEAAVLLLISIAYIITRSFWVSVVAHAYIKLMIIPIMLWVINKCFKDLIKTNRKKAVILCAVPIIIDNVILSTVRYFISGGVSSIVLFPLMIPACFMILMHYMGVKKIGYTIGVPLLLVSLYFEIISLIA